MICTEETRLMSKLDFDLVGSGPVGGALALWKAKALLSPYAPSLVLVMALGPDGISPTTCSKKDPDCSRQLSSTPAVLS